MEGRKPITFQEKNESQAALDGYGQADGCGGGTPPPITLISWLDYMDDMLTEAGNRLAMEVAAVRFRRAPATSP